MFKLNKEIIILVGIVFIASFLRFFRIEENLVFHGELGVDYLAVRNIIQGKQTPLLGPPTSHPWLSISPLFYWIFTLVLPIADYHPIAGAYFMAGIGVLTVILAYFVIRHFLGEKVGLLSSYLLAISPAWIELTRNSRFNLFIPFLFFPFLYFLVKSIQTNSKNIFWLGIVMGISYSFFPAIIIWLPVSVILIYLRRKKIKQKNILLGLIGIIIPNIPFIIYNALNKFEIIIKLLAWIPYRTAGFFGLYPKNTANPEIIKANFSSLYVFFRESWFPEESNLAVLLFLVVIGFFVVKAALEILRKNDFWLSLTVVFIVTYLGLFIHGDPPKHYYYIIFPIPIILLATFLTWLSKKRLGIFISFGVLALLTLSSLRFYFSTLWFYQLQDKVIKGSLPVPYIIQEDVVDLIFKDANGRGFELARVGPYDHFEADYAMNYHYLLWREGNEPVDEASLKYTIHEDTVELPKNGEKVIWVRNIAVLKEDNEN